MREAILNSEQVTAPGRGDPGTSVDAKARKRGLSIRARLWGLGLVSALGVVVVAGAGFFSMARSQAATEQIVSQHVAALKDLGVLEEAMGRIAAAEMQAVINFQVKSAVQSSVGEWRGGMAASKESAARIAQVAGQADVTRRLDEMQAALDTYAKGFDAFLQRVNQGAVMSVEAGDLLIAPSRKDFRTAQDALQAVARDVAGAASNSQGELAAGSARATRTLSVVAVLALLAVALLARTTLRSVTAPIAVAQDAFKRIAAGDLSTPVPVGRRDEMGAMLGALEDMRQHLSATIQTLRESVRHVAHASAEIASGNDDLSTRTEVAAAGLQRTVSSISEVNDAAAHSAQLAGKADADARGASATMTDVQRAMVRLAGRMARIEEGAKQIADITQIIDRIAFQTNVLALNASVEAAHGGERGKGFSVVANEVRELAQRCAQASHEIRGLVEEANVRVIEGAREADDTAKAVEQANAAIQGVCGVIEDIAGVTRAQTSAIAHISHSMTEHEDKVQQDVALVEQCAAATRQLQESSAGMLQMVGRFRLGEGG